MLSLDAQKSNGNPSMFSCIFEFDAHNWRTFQSGWMAIRADLAGNRGGI
jgi:hypothetical protein